MQEKFALRKTLKKVAALGTSLALVGVTVSGALAAGLGDLPAPFNNNPAQTVVVFGDAGNDVLSANEVLFAVDGSPIMAGTNYQVTSNLGELSLEDFETGERQDIAVGGELDDDFGRSVDETDSVGLIDGSIAIDIARDTDYDYHEVCDIGDGSGDEPMISSAIDQGDEDFGENAALLIPEEDFQCRIEFEEDLDANNTISRATDDDTVTIPFLGKTLVITSATRTSITAYTGDKVRLRIGDTLQVNGRTITLNGVDDDGVLLEVDGIAESIDQADRERVNGIEIYVEDSFNSDVDANDQAIIIASSDEALETYDNGDEYPGQDENNFLWEWNLTGLNETDQDLIVIGVMTHEDMFSAETDEFEDEIMDLGLLKKNQAYLTEGDYLCLPNRYVCLVMENLDNDITWSDYIFNGNDRESLDLNANGDSDISSARVIEIKSNVGSDRGLTTIAGHLASRAELENVDTMWLYWNSSGQKPSQASNTENNLPRVLVFSADRSTGMAELVDLNNNGSSGQYDDYLPNSSRNVTVPIARFDNGDYNAYIYVNVSFSNVTFITVGSVGPNATLVNLTFDAVGDSTGFPFLGDRDGEDASTYFCAADSASSADFDCNDTGEVDIAGWDENVLKNDGVVVKDPEGNLDNDRVELKVPNDDEFEYWVKIAKPRTGSAVTSSDGTPAAASLSMKDTEVGDVMTLNKNVVAVGGPAVNSVTADLLGVSFPTYGADVAGLSEGTAVLELKDLSGGKKALLVYGWEADDTRRAALVVKNAATFRSQLGSGNSAMVSGDTLEVSGITVTAA